MLTYETIKMLCKRKGVTVTGTEKELGFARGSLCKVNTSKPSMEKVQKLANYFNVSVEFLMNDGDCEENGDIELTTKDERDITKDLQKMMASIRTDKDGPLYYNGEEIDEASLILLENALEHAMRETKKINKRRFGRKKEVI